MSPFLTDLLKAYSFISVFLAMPLKLHPSALTKLNSKMKLEKTGTVALSTKWSNVPFRTFDEKDKPDMVILISKLNDD